VFNPDGSINQICGTAPDVALPPATLPPVCDRAGLLADPWVQWVLKE
jgi:hypothetical protein